jgi:hypothetical protein
MLESSPSGVSAESRDRDVDSGAAMIGPGRPSHGPPLTTTLMLALGFHVVGTGDDVNPVPRRRIHIVVRGHIVAQKLSGPGGHTAPTRHMNARRPRSHRRGDRTGRCERSWSAVTSRRRDTSTRSAAAQAGSPPEIDCTAGWIMRRPVVEMAPPSIAIRRLTDEGGTQHCDRARSVSAFTRRRASEAKREERGRMRREAK